ncbi:fer-1-like protein 6 [Hermetia illucens]|nr:fer-1-like protein 6 [Hermetia illucens]
MVKKKMVLQKLKALTNMFPPPLKWIPISADGAVTAEVLISGELIEEKDDFHDSNIEVLTKLPAEICPVNKKFRVEVIFIGFRNFRKSYYKAPMGAFRMKLFFADLSLVSGPSAPRNGQSINFTDFYSTGIVHLPEQQEYWPPVIMTHIQITKGNQEFTIGAAMLSNAHRYLMNEEVSCSSNKTVTFEDDDDSSRATHLEMETSFYSETHAETTPLLSKARKPENVLSTKWQIIPSLLAKLKGQRKDPTIEASPKEEREFSWWTKFYNSVEHGDDNAIDVTKHHLVIYGSELENQIEFNFLQDWAEPVPLIRGIQHKRNGPPKEESYASIKCHIEVKKCKSQSQNVGPNEKLLKNARNVRFQEICSLLVDMEVVVRVYIVQGLRIRSMDRYSESDSYVKLQFGDKVISDRANYIPNQTNPVFGKVFQIEGIIPREHILHISLYDRDLFDDLIGCTNIDLEDRLRSKHRAAIGISNEYSESGYNVWRDLKSPRNILHEVAAKYDLDPPEIKEDKLYFAGKVFSDTSKISRDEKLENRLCLSVLKKLDEIPEIGYKLVPEHVETRSLYRTNRPGIEQGKLQLWVEIYEKDNVPPPLDITPIPARKYELRAIILNTSGVILDEKNIFGKKMSDIYLKGWLEDIDEAQYTDVHYRSLNGEGNFNWRMIFPLRYSRVEDKMVLRKKAAIYERFDTEVKVPPVFYLQIWDNDVFSPDDFLGVVNVNLSHFKEPVTTAKKCSLRQQTKYVNLFNVGTVKGWFPAEGKFSDGSIGLTGKVEMILQVLTEPEAASRPAGLGRNPPEQLPDPKRPETSFSWFANPFLSFKHILMPQIKKCLCYICIVVIIVALIITFIYALPGQLMKKTVGL